MVARRNQVPLQRGAAGPLRRRGAVQRTAAGVRIVLELVVHVAVQRPRPGLAMVDIGAEAARLGQPALAGQRNLGRGVPGFVRVREMFSRRWASSDCGTSPLPTRRVRVAQAEIGLGIGVAPRQLAEQLLDVGRRMVAPAISRNQSPAT
jgi:hypothetical protein